MKSFKDIVKETVAEPKGEDEKRFKKQHTDNVRVFDYGSKTSERATKKYARKIPRLADYQKGEDEAAYDQAYSEEVSLDEEMTDAQKKKREEIVKELKKKKDEFKDNYGDDWKDVMYATATKMAMKEETLSEDPWEEVPMMERQLEFICYAAEEIKSYVTMGVDPEEWFQNKLAHVHGQMRTLHAYIEGDKRIRSAKTMDPFHIGEQNDLNEEVIDDLKKILKDKSMDEVTLSNGDKLDVDIQTANILLKIYDALSGQNKKKFVDALNKNEKMFMKMLDFAYSKVK
jgi:ribosomal protein S15P/S13E